MKRVFEGFLNMLERYSAFLERISRPMEIKLAYFFCGLQILTCVIAIVIAAGIFVVEMRKDLPWDMRLFLIVVFLILLFMLGAWIHMIITRDLRHIKDEHPAKKDPNKDNKIEF